MWFHIAISFQNRIQVLFTWNKLLTLDFWKNNTQYTIEGKKITSAVPLRNQNLLLYPHQYVINIIWKADKECISDKRSTNDVRFTSLFLKVYALIEFSCLSQSKQELWICGRRSLNDPAIAHLMLRGKRWGGRKGGLNNQMKIYLLTTNSVK